MQSNAPSRATQLRDVIVAHFDSDDMWTELMFGLGISADNVRGETRATRATALVEKLARAGRLNELETVIRKARPKVVL